MKPTMDDLLKEWGIVFTILQAILVKEEIFEVAVLFYISPTSSTHPSTLQHKFALTINKAPEVMVKITGGGKNMKHIKAHFDYISRQGELKLEDENGEIYQGIDEVKMASTLWAQGKIPIPLTGEKRREALNLVLSMPAGTDKISVEQAARLFAAEQFNHHQYVFTAHHDEAHPHVHLLIKITDKFGVRLNPRKRDLQQWREHFASNLREQGIAANATPCLARGVRHQSKKYTTYLTEKKAPKSPVHTEKRLPSVKKFFRKSKHPSVFV
jgi:hypothetical protein